MHRFNTPRALFLSLTALCAFSTLAAPSLDMNHGAVRSAIAKQNSVTPKLIKTPGVLGTAVGLDSNGDVSVIIYVDINHPGARGLKPPPGTEIVLTEQFRAGGPKGNGGPGGGGTTIDHKGIQSAPIALGTSGGWAEDSANGYCCGGTLGSLIKVETPTSTNKFILSNYHVLEADKVSGGNGVVATDGTAVIQPGLIDVGCNDANAQDVAALKVLNSLPNHNVDVGIAEILPGMVRENGEILGIGTISAATQPAALNQAVKKSGRTSGLTRSKITGLNATVNVTYENECAGSAAFTRTFTGQIVISKGATFLKSGDSGSLMVQDVATNPKAIGLLYAGSSQVAIANPIGQVLSFIGSALGGTATMVGQ